MKEQFETVSELALPKRIVGLLKILEQREQAPHIGSMPVKKE
jgi:hypothetical protein